MGAPWRPLATPPEGPYPPGIRTHKIKEPLSGLAPPSILARRAMNHMSPTVRSRAVLLLALAMLLVPAGLYHPGDAAECTPVCDNCHYAHDQIYHAYADIYEFSVPSTIDGAERKQVRVMIQLYGSVGLGYTTISRGG